MNGHIEILKAMLDDDYPAPNFTMERDALKAAIAALAAPKEAGDIRLWDSQWVNVVNHADCYAEYTKEEAVAIATRLTEQYMLKNITAGFPPPRPAAPSKEAGPAGEFLGWVHECVWKDGTSRSLHQREPKLMDAIEPDGSPLAGLVSQRIVRVYANPPGDQRQEGEAFDFRQVLGILKDDSPPPEAAVTDAMVDAAIACWFRDTAHWDADEWAEQRPPFRVVLTAALAARDGGAA